jgi:hypothetical protein
LTFSEGIVQSTPLQSKPGTAAKVAASLAILSILSLQAFTAIFHRVCSRPIPILCSLAKDPGLYPFLNYPMYNKAHAEGATVDQYTLKAIFADGTQKQLSEENFSLSLYQFNTGVLKAIQNDDRPKIQQYIAAYNQANPQPFVTLQLETTPLVITREGVTEGKSKVINSISTVSRTVSTEE